MDIAIHHDRGPPPRYDAQRDQQAPLTEKEKNYLWQNIARLKPENREVVMQAYQALKSKLIVPRDYYDIDRTDRDHEDNGDQDNYSIERGGSENQDDKLGDHFGTTMMIEGWDCR
jgi:hypothetical protein